MVNAASNFPHQKNILRSLHFSVCLKIQTQYSVTEQLSQKIVHTAKYSKVEWV